MSQRTVILNLSGEEISSYERALITHPSESEDTRMTLEIWYRLFVGLSEPAVRLRVEVGGAEVERLLWLPGVEQTPNVHALLARPTRIVTGDSIALTITLDRPAPEGGVRVEVRDTSGTFASTSAENAPTVCLDCIAEVMFLPNQWEQETELRATQVNEAGAHLTAVTPFFPGTEGPVGVSVRVQP